MESLEHILDLIKSSFLPELRQDLDSIPIEREHFKNYHECLQLQLPILYDWIQQQQQNHCLEDIGDVGNQIKQEIEIKLIILLCEISSPNSIFYLDNSELLRNADRVLKKFGNSLTKEGEELIFKYYEEKLHKDRWKKQLGAVHGFIKYLELLINSERNPEYHMNHRLLMFCLAVALNIRSCYETHYKSLSTTIFLLMLQQGLHDDIISMNIHSVIYDAVFKDIHIMDSEVFIEKQWNCLVKCLDFYMNLNSFEWSYLDDMMEVLLRNISLAPESTASLCLLKFVGKLIVYFTINNREFEEVFAHTITLENISNYRSLGSSNTSYTNYRWCKTILQMFVIESHKLMQKKEICLELLQEIHRIYILAMLPIPLNIIEVHLVTFLEKFIAVLMETVKLHKFYDDIVQAITCLMETFYCHLQTAKESSQLFKCKQSIYGLLKTKTFERFITI